MAENWQKRGQKGFIWGCTGFNWGCTGFIWGCTAPLCNPLASCLRDPLYILLPILQKKTSVCFSRVDDVYLFKIQFFDVIVCLSFTLRSTTIVIQIRIMVFSLCLVFSGHSIAQILRFLISSSLRNVKL